MKENKKPLLILGSHAHVPSGASENEFKYAYDNIMRPFVSNLYRYPNIHAVLHYSGVLLYWVERNHPEFFMLIEDMVMRKQAEIIGGGFYEPMFPIIPQQDRIGQIELLTTYIRKHFGKRPLGCWLPYMAWEQNMAASLSASDMQYTFLSQDQFLSADINGFDLFYPCITEDQGKLVSVFPVCKNVENELEIKSFSQCFIEFKNNIDETYKNNLKDLVVSIFPEKILHSHNESVDTAWNRFFEEISLSENIIETSLPQKILKNFKIFNKASFPNSSSIDSFSPRKYLINNPEANSLYSKMIFTNVLINQLKGDRSRKQNAREELLKAQDCCLYTNSNGYNIHALRKSAYSSLIKAEQISREKGRFISSLIQYDYDFDGNKEFLFQDIKLNCYIHLKGAGIFELDYLPKEWNYFDCTEGMMAFSDIILPPQIEISDLKENYLKEAVRLCFNEQYDSISQDRKGKSCFKLSKKNTNINNNDEQYNDIEIYKCYSLKKDILTVNYQLKNTAKESVSFCFLPKINFSFAGGSNDFIRIFAINKDKEIQVENSLESLLDSIETLKILDITNEVQILLSSANLFSGCLFSIFNKGFYSSTCILPIFSVTIEGGRTWNHEFTIKFTH